MPSNRLICATLVVGVGLAFSAVGKEAVRDNYRTYCTQCHGKDGTGKGINIRDMSVQPRDHTDAKAMSGRSDDTIFKVIKEGGPSIDKSVLMPPWGDTFSDEEIRDLVAYLRQLCKCSYGASPGAPAP